LAGAAGACTPFKELDMSLELFRFEGLVSTFILATALGGCAGAQRATGTTTYGSAPSQGRSLATASSSTFEERSGRFMLDLPEGYKLEAQRTGELYEFAASAGPNMNFLFGKGEKQLAGAFDNVVDMVKGQLPGLTTTTPPVEVTVNGLPARLGLYRGQIAAGGITVALFALVGTVALPDGTLTLNCIFNDSQRPTWEGRAREVFATVRPVGAAVTGLAVTQTGGQR
jgi:hypothetical protein